MNAPVTTSPYAGARWWITRHAVAQWAERFDMTATDGDAVRTLAEVSRGAWDTGTETPDGRAVWMHDDHPRARFVVARPERRASGAWGLPTLVTVLPLEFAESRRARGMKR